MSGQESLLEQRYGVRQRRTRLGALIGLGLVALVFLGWLGWAALYHGTPEVESDLVAFEVAGEHRTTARVQVTLGDEVDPDEADCRVRAYAADHSTVGERVFTPTPGAQEVTVRTERRATAVEVIGCTTADQQRPR